jgi:hypothetical protein
MARVRAGRREARPTPALRRRRRSRFGLPPTPSHRRLAWPRWSPQLPSPPGALGESPRRIGVPCDTTAERGKGRLRLARPTPVTLTAAPLSIRLRAKCIADISPDFTPPYPGFGTGLSHFRAPGYGGSRASAGGRLAPRASPGFRGRFGPLQRRAYVQGGAGPGRFEVASVAVCRKRVKNRLRAEETPGAKGTMESQ